jgi:hypothetical protein
MSARSSQDSNAAQCEAIRRYPDLGVAGTNLNREFVVRYKAYKQSKPEFFESPDWPIRLAEELHRTGTAK